MSNTLIPTPTPTPRRRRSLLSRLFLVPGNPGDLVIFCHSNLFYWWPVWAVGFILAGITYFENHHMGIVPAHTVAARGRQVEVEKDGKLQTETRDVLIAPAGAQLPIRPGADDDAPLQPRIFMSLHKALGVVFMVVLLLVIVITNVPMRGLWSLLSLILLVSLAVILGLLGVWERIFTHVGLLAIHINLGGYLFLSVVLLVIWLFNFVLFDRQFYVVITTGQVRVHLQVGGGESAYDASGIVFQKERSDLFRHYILGFGSGDLVIRPVNCREPILLPNVMAVGRRVRQIERRLQQKEIVAAD